jgi:hypothetical protein
MANEEIAVLVFLFTFIFTLSALYDRVMFCFLNTDCQLIRITFPFKLIQISEDLLYMSYNIVHMAEQFWLTR